MRKLSTWTASAAALALLTVITFTRETRAHESGPLMCSAVKWKPGIGFEFCVDGPHGAQVAIQVSDDLKKWTSLKTSTISDHNTVLLDNYTGPSLPNRFYRVQLVESQPAPTEPLFASLDDLTLPLNRVFTPGDGFNTAQFAPSGKLGLIVWRDQSLVYRERRTVGQWAESIVRQGGSIFASKSYDEHRFQPPAALLFDSASNAHVLIHVGSQQIAHYIRAGGQWTQQAAISTQGLSNSVSLFEAAFGPGDKLHIAAVSSGSSPAIVHGTNASGTWRWSQAGSIAGDARGYLKQSYAPRPFAFAVDASNRPHIAYCSGFHLHSGPGGYPKPYSELNYATESNGQWIRERVWWPKDGSGDAGLGASIAIAPDGTPVIASVNNDRADTGSSQGSQLLYHQRRNGSWSTEVLNRNADNYNAGDGDRGTGWAPHLRFDSTGRPHILFSDHAAEHFPNSGQMEYAGQIRHAYHNGSSWKFRTVYRQTNPKLSQIVYPAMALGNNELFFISVQRNTIWGPDTWPRTMTSTYQWVHGKATARW